jgi:hypothetical protein
MWLQATAVGIAVAPTTTLLFLLRLDPAIAREVLPPGGQEVVDRLRQRFEALFPAAVGNEHVFMFMLGHAPPPLLRSRRRPTPTREARPPG